jgi:uncharacterized protein YcbX
MPEIAELYVYPIKSLSGVKLEAAEVQTRGLQHDRRWMLVEQDGSFITQRDDPSLVKFRVAITRYGLMVTAPGMDSCRISFGARGPYKNVRVWKSELPAQIVDPVIDDWFSEAIRRPCHLVALPDDAGRTINPEYGDSLVSFADAMPILVLSQSSLDDLSQRVNFRVPVDRFRANIILRGTEPFDEDSAEGLRIGNVRLAPTKRCGRCLVTCTDQATGERGTEPLHTLAGYRLYANNACMGMYYAPKTLGRIAVGQEVEVVDKVVDGEWLVSP